MIEMAGTADRNAPEQPIDFAGIRSFFQTRFRALSHIN